LKVQMRAGGAAGVAGRADERPLANRLAGGDVDAAEMGVESLIAVAVVNHDQVAEAVGTPGGKGDSAGVGGIDGRSFPGRYIKSGVAIPVILGDVTAANGPDKGSGAQVRYVDTLQGLW